MENITLEHVRQGAEWAKEAGEQPTPIDGQTRMYKQNAWDCGTSCCMWGAASLKAGCGPAAEGPSAEWASQSLIHTLAAGIMRCGTATPEQMIALLDRGSNLRGSDLSGSDLSGSDLRGSDLSGSNLSGSNLRGSDLRGSDLSGSNLSGSNLSGSNLSGSDLSGSDLSGSDLSGSNLSGSNLRGSDLSGATVKIGNVYRRIA